MAFGSAAPNSSVGNCDVVFMEVIDQCATVAGSLVGGLSFWADVLRSRSSRRRQESCTSSDTKAREKPVEETSTSRRARSAFCGMMAIPVTAIVMGVTMMRERDM